MKRILLVEDSEDCFLIVRRILSQYKVTRFESVDPALVALRNEHFDLIILDIEMPGKSGYDLLTELHAIEMNHLTPVICLTGQTDITAKVTAFSLGADDYVVKPFNHIEFKARVDAKLTRQQRLQAGSMGVTVGDLEVDPSAHRVMIGESSNRREVNLTHTEFKLLRVLMKRPGQVYSREQLLVAAWGESAKVLDRVVDVHLCSLRKKLGVFSHNIDAVAGVGYRLIRREVLRAAVA